MPDGYDDLKPRLILVLAHLSGPALIGIDPGGRLPNCGWEVRLTIVEAQAEDELLGGSKFWLEDWLRLHKCDGDFIPAPTVSGRPTRPSQ